MGTQPFDNYKNEGVEYDYIIGATVQVGGISKENISSILQLIKDEDLLAMFFKSVARGRVYPKVEYLNNKLHFTFGISLIDAEEHPTSKDIIKEIKDFIISLNKNIEDTDLNIKESDIKVDIITEEFDIYNVDKKLVTEGALSFTKGNNTVYIKLTEDGMVEHNVNNELIETYPFAKLKLIRECRQLIQDGYILGVILTEDTNVANRLDNPDEIKQELEQQIADVDEIQELKSELDNKLDELVEENLEIENKIVEFPVTEFTTKPLSSEDELNLTENLTNEQQDWILQYICDDIMDFEKLLRDFIITLSISTEPIISINEFIKQLRSIITSK